MAPASPTMAGCWGNGVSRRGRNGARAGPCTTAFASTGHFLERHVFAAMGAAMPAARRRLEERVRQAVGAP